MFISRELFGRKLQNKMDFIGAIIDFPVDFFRIVFFSRHILIPEIQSFIGIVF